LPAILLQKAPGKAPVFLCLLTDIAAAADNLYISTAKEINKKQQISCFLLNIP